MDTDLLVNPNIVNIGVVDLPSISFDDVVTETVSESAPAPRLVPSASDMGGFQSGGMPNFNADPYVNVSSSRRVSDDTLAKEKYDLLRKFERLGKMGVPMRKRFTMDSSLEEMRLELEFVRNEKAKDKTIKQFSEWFITGMSALEHGSEHGILRMAGLRLSGLSESAQMNVVDLEDDFEELYDLYGDNLKMHPLISIPMRTCLMIYMVHLTNQTIKNAPVPNIDEIMRQNPDIARQLAGAALQQQTQKMRTTAAQPSQSAPNPLSGLMSFMQSGMPPAPPPSMVVKPPPENKTIQFGSKGVKVKELAPPPAPTPAPEMKGPSVNIDEMLKSIRTNVIPANHGKLPEPVKVKKPGSTGKNSVVIKL